jgi:hypothetical protein
MDAVREGQPSVNRRRSPLREDWDAIRAASHMIACFGSRAIAVAHQRARNGGDAATVWERIALAIQKLEEQRPAAPARATQG